MEKAYIGAIRAAKTKNGGFSVLLTNDQARAYLVAQSTSGAQIRIDWAIHKALEYLLKDEAQ